MYYYDGSQPTYNSFSMEKGNVYQYESMKSNSNCHLNLTFLMSVTYFKLSSPQTQHIQNRIHYLPPIQLFVLTYLRLSTAFPSSYPFSTQWRAGWLFTLSHYPYPIGCQYIICSSSLVPSTYTISFFLLPHHQFSQSSLQMTSVVVRTS